MSTTTNEAKAARSLRQVRFFQSDAGVMKRQHEARLDPHAEIARLGFVPLPGGSDLITSYIENVEDRASAHFLVHVHLAACDFICNLADIREYAAFMRTHAPVAAALDLLFL